MKAKNYFETRAADCLKTMSNAELFPTLCNMRVAHVYLDQATLWCTLAAQSSS